MKHSASEKGLAGLHEVVDAQNRPVCLMPRQEILRQKLCHRAVALLLRDFKGRVLLVRRPGLGFGFSAFAMLPQGMACEDFCREILKKHWQTENARILAIRLDKPRPETRNAFTAIFEAAISAAHARLLALADPENRILLDRAEFAALAERGNLISPFASLAHASGFLRFA